MNSAFSLLMKIHIHPLFWGIFVIGILTATVKQLFLLFIIVIIHELGHAVAAQCFSWRIRRIMLLPFGGVAEVDEHGNRPFREEFIVTISGPLQHLWMFGAAFLLMKINVLSLETYEQFMFQCTVILLFNLLPIWPLDGGKLLFLMCSRSLPFLEAHKLALRLSTFFLASGIIYAVIMHPFQLHLWIVISFLIISGYLEWKSRQFVYMRFLLERYHGKEHPIGALKTLSVSTSETIHQVLQKFQRGCKHMIIATSQTGEHVQIDENELLHAYFVEKRTNSLIDELVTVY
ncbi:M50 family metallopeptidase [Priestia aryabhattai]|uniref:M50 family metallopeptidase n=1 Tax=Priestia aryabhattai TaxID=412384 RepID=UPI003D282A30